MQRTTAQVRRRTTERVPRLRVRRRVVGVAGRTLHRLFTAAGGGPKFNHLPTLSPVDHPNVLTRTLLLLLAGACSRPSAQAVRDSAAAASPSVAAAQSRPSTVQTPPLSGGTTCPTWGKWEPCNVENRLTRSGLTFQRTPDPVRYEFMHVPGIEYDNPVARILVFIYPDQKSREADTNLLDPETVSPRDKKVYYKEPATLVTSINLAAIVITLNERFAERVDNALGAGLPADPPPGKP